MLCAQHGSAVRQRRLRLGTGQCEMVEVDGGAVVWEPFRSAAEAPCMDCTMLSIATRELKARDTRKDCVFNSYVLQV